MKDVMFIIPLLSGFISFLFFLVLFLITRGKGMGLGDVKLSFAIGFLLGWPSTLIAQYVAFLTGAIVALILIIGRKKKFFGGTIPFGPFLAIGTMVGFLFGGSIWQTIIKFFL
jgi:prepilin signal peptidase PulO-like enzyme (type II secretory pathway)